MLEDCPICLDILDRSINVIITLECCKKDIHLNCIKNWIIEKNNINNINNFNKKQCILCRRESVFLNDLYNNINTQLLDNSNNLIHSIDINTIETNNVLTHKCQTLIILCIIYISISSTILLIIYNV